MGPKKVHVDHVKADRKNDEGHEKDAKKESDVNDHENADEDIDTATTKHTATTEKDQAKKEHVDHAKEDRKRDEGHENDPREAKTIVDIEDEETSDAKNHEKAETNENKDEHVTTNHRGTTHEEESTQNADVYVDQAKE